MGNIGVTGETGARVALVTVDYPPQRTSAAVQMRDLADEMRRQGHRPTIIVPTAGMSGDWQIEHLDGIEILRLRAPQTRDIGYIRRTINESLLPWTMLHRMLRCPLKDVPWDLIVWYSPTIFFGPFIAWLKHRSRARAYLILRDIFPEWALDLGILRRGPAYWYFRAVAKYQYAQADVIGVQTKSNRSYLERWSRKSGRKLEVLNNWQHAAPNVGCSLDLSSTTLRGRKIFAYIGNMGVAQGMDVLIDMAENLAHRPDAGVIFVGRGSDFARLQAEVKQRNLTNVLFFDEIPSAEIPGLLNQCYGGLIALDPSHKSHNIPGKFLSYLRAGLPVLARVNVGTDLVQIIDEAGVGQAFTGHAGPEMARFAEALMDDPSRRANVSACARNLAERDFSPTATVIQVMSHMR